MWTIAILAAAAAIAQAPVASPSTSKWRIENSPSQIEDARSVTAVLDSTNRLRDNVGALEAATLFVQCEDGELNVYVAWPPDMGDEDRPVRWTFDADVATDEIWTGAVLGTATFSPKPYEFAARLAGAKHLVIDAPRLQQSGVEAVFDTNGADKVVAAALAACPKP